MESYSKLERLTKRMAVMLIGFAAAIAFVLPCAAYADTATVDGVTYTYEATDSGSTVKVTGMTSSTTTAATVPNVIDGKPITVIYLMKTRTDEEDKNDNGSSAGSAQTVVNPNLGKITSVDLRSCAQLKNATFSDCNLSELKLPSGSVLSMLYVRYNNLTSLDVSNCSGLTYLYCDGNKLTSLNVSKNPQLKELGCPSNLLTVLNVENNPNLYWLDCWGNKLTSLNISKNTKLTELHCEENYISDTSALEKWAKEPGHYSTILPQKVTSNSGNAGTTTPSASGKWNHNSKGWWYTYANGTYAKGLQTIGNATYFFDNNGWMKTGWQHAKGGSDWYYFDKSGAMKTGWQKISGKWYYLNSEGKMLTGKQTIKNKTYFLNKSGAMQTGWVKNGSSWYYCNKSGAMTTGWQKVSGKWYYLSSEGKMLTGKQTIVGKIYFLNKSGAMQTGWVKDGSDWYFCASSGAAKTSAWISGKYWVDANGIMATNTWVDGDKYFVGSDGAWVRGKKK